MAAHRRSSSIPKSQGGRLGKRWPELADTHRPRVSVRRGAHAGPGRCDAAGARGAARGAERIVAIGGDGTVNEVVNGFFDEQGAPIAPEASFALIPFGTGGDFRRTMNMPDGDRGGGGGDRARTTRKRIDVGKLELTATGGAPRCAMFANIASFGVSGVVDRLVNESRQEARRGCRSCSRPRARRGRTRTSASQLVFDGKDRVEATINTVAVANGRYFGGGDEGRAERRDR